MLSVPHHDTVVASWQSAVDCAFAPLSCLAPETDEQLLAYDKVVQNCHFNYWHSQHKQYPGANPTFLLKTNQLALSFYSKTVPDEPLSDSFINSWSAVVKCTVVASCNTHCSVNWYEWTQWKRNIKWCMRVSDGYHIYRIICRFIVRLLQNEHWCIRAVHKNTHKTKTNSQYLSWPSLLN